MTIRNHHGRGPRQSKTKTIDLVSLTVLFVCVVGIALGLVGVGTRGTEMWVLIPPTIVGCFAILNLNR